MAASLSWFPSKISLAIILVICTLLVVQFRYFDNSFSDQLNCLSDTQAQEICQDGLKIVDNELSYETAHRYKTLKLDRRKSVWCASLCAGQSAKYWTSEPANVYAVAQKRFFIDMSEHASFSQSGVVMFFDLDQATLSVHTKKALATRGIVFLRHSGRNELSPYEVLQPDHPFILSRGYTEKSVDFPFETITHFKVPVDLTPYAERKKSVFWRGTYTGWNRIALCKAASAVSATHDQVFPVADAKISGDYLTLVNYSVLPDPIVMKEGVYEAYSVNKSSEAVWMRHRGVFDIAGVVDSGGLYWRLRSGSVVFKVETNYTNRFVDKLIPWVHYIPVYENFSNLENVTSLVLSDDPGTLAYMATVARQAAQMTQLYNYPSQLSMVIADLNHKFGAAHSLNLYHNPPPVVLVNFSAGDAAIGMDDG